LTGVKLTKVRQAINHSQNIVKTVVLVHTDKVKHQNIIGQNGHWDGTQFTSVGLSIGFPQKANLTTVDNFLASQRELGRRQSTGIILKKTQVGPVDSRVIAGKMNLEKDFVQPRLGYAQFGLSEKPRICFVKNPTVDCL
jgi:hypothetical protein